jgi:hypothetical protein
MVSILTTVTQKVVEESTAKSEKLTILKGIITLWGKLSKLLLFLR